MTAPAPSNLDFEQCIRGAYEDDTGRLRVDADLKFDADGQVLVDIKAEDKDSVLIAGTLDGTPTGTVQYVKVNADGSINANVTLIPPTPTVSNVISSFNSVSSVSSSVLTTINTYTVPVGKTGFLALVETSGTNIAQFEIYINNVLNAVRRTYFGSDLNELFEYKSIEDAGLQLAAGDTVKVKVIHFRPTVGDFEARILVSEQ